MRRVGKKVGRRNEYGERKRKRMLGGAKLGERKKEKRRRREEGKRDR